MTFGDLSKFIKTLHKTNRNFIPIVDAGFAKRTDYEAFTDGIEKDVFIKANTISPTKAPFIGNDWPGDVAFPDFMKSTTTFWWK